MVEKPKSERASLKHGTVPGADLKQGDGKENNLEYATFTASVKHFVSKELFSISPVFTVVSRKGGNNAYAIFVVVFWGGGGRDSKVNKVYYGQCESGESPTQKKRHLFSLLPLFYSVAVDHLNNTLLVITNL